MVKLEQRNELIIGSIAGMIAAAVKYGFNELTQILNIAKYDNNATALGTVMSAWEYNPLFWVFGFIVALIIGAFFGVLFAFAFRYLLSEDHYLLKGAILGAGIWLFNFAIMSKVFNYPKDMGTSLGDIVSMLISLTIFGVVCAYSLKKLGLFKKTS